MLRKALPLLMVAIMIAGLAWAAEEDVKVSFSDQPITEAESGWAPQYGEKGELLNGEPAVVPFGANVSGDQPGQPPLIQTVVLDETFSNWGPYGDIPPAGWTIDDNGTMPVLWDNYDWNRYVGGTGWGSTALARIYGNSSSYTNDDWIVSPSVDLTSATAVTLNFRMFYDDYSTVAADSFMVYLSDDGGATWGNTVVVYGGADHGTVTTPVIDTWDVSAFTAGKSNIKVAFRYYKPVYSLAAGAGVDNIEFLADAVQVFYETMDATWGPNGNNPPAGWTIIDAAVPDPWNNNDWAKYYYTTWADTIARVYFSPIEDQDEWLISPAVNLSPASDQVVLSYKSYYDDDTGTAADSAFVLGSIDGGTTWPYLLATYTDADQGSSSSPLRPAIDITSWANGQANVKFAFKYVGYNGYGWYLDSVKVETIDLPNDDVMTTAINSPQVGVTGYNLPVSTQVYNNGTNPATFTDYTKIDAFNYQTYLYEEFGNPQGWTGANPPVNIVGTWAVLDSGSVPGTWDTNDWYGNYYSTWSDTIARITDNPDENQNDYLITPSMNLTAANDVHLTFKVFYDDFSSTPNDDTCWVIGTADDWATTNLIALYTGADYGSSSSPMYPDYNISAWADGQANVKIAFRYVGYNDYGVYLDKVHVYQIMPSTTVYNSNETVTALGSLESRAVPYTATWNDPNAGEYMVTTYTNLAGDANRNNDTLTSIVEVFEHYEAGGPDGGYYSWDTNKDGGTGEAYSWVDITGIGTPVTWNAGTGDDRYTYGIDMGFSFPFYGNSYNRIFLNENGIATFDSLTTTELTNYTIPSTSGAENLLAFFWDNLNGVAGNAYYYTDNTGTFIVSFIDWDFDNDLAQRIDVQMILDGTDGSIKYQYQTVGPVIYTSHTIGIENAAGDIGLQFMYNGNPMGNLPLAGLAVTFTYAPPALDASAFEVVAPVHNSYIQVNQAIAPKGIVSNLGSSPISLTAYFEIHDAIGATIYSNSVPMNLAGLSSDTATFGLFTPTVIEKDTSIFYVVLGGDSNNSNDTVKAIFNVDTHVGEGGPDNNFYQWIDNTIADPNAPTYGWIDITADGTPINIWDNGTGDAGRTNPIYMGIPGGFFYYGIMYDSLVIGTDCWTSFLRQSSNYESNYQPPSTSGPTAGVFVGWDDHIDTTGAMCYYKYDAANNRFIVSWVDYTYYQTTGVGRNPHDVQVIFDADDSTVVMQFGPVTGAYDLDVTTGIQNQARNIGLNYYYGSSTTIPGTPKLNVPYDGLAIKYFYNPPTFSQVIDFEANNGSFDGTNDWMWGQPLAGEPPAAYSGINCWGTAMDDNTPTPSTISNLDVPIQITGTDPLFMFYEWYEGSTASFYYRILVDDGTGFVELAEWQGSNTTWHPRLVDLSAYTGVITVRLQMEIGTYISYSGWYVDDFSFADCAPFYPANEVKLASFDAPLGYILQDGMPYDILATVQNRGTNTVSFNVNANDGHGYTLSVPVTGLLPGASQQVTFPGWAPALECSTYTVTVTTQLPGDQDPTNDAASRDFLIINDANTYVQYDTGILSSAWRFIGAGVIMANEFEAPYQGVELSAVTMMFANLDISPTWPDSDRDTVELFIFVDDDHDGMPDATPVHYARKVPPEHGPLIWNIGCEATVTINCQSFWAGWAQIDTFTMKEAIIRDVTTDYPTVCWVGSSGGWSQYDAMAGDEMIRAYFDNQNPGSVADIAFGSLTMTATAPAGGNTTVTNTIDNIGTGCGVRYWVENVVQNYVPLAASNGAKGSRNASVDVESNVPTEGEIQPIKIETVTNEKGTFIEPQYPPIITSSGGPDIFGYTWIDSDEPGGPTVGWIDISTIGTPVTLTDDSFVGPIPVGFAFPFYGNTYPDLFIGSNGIITFGSGSTSISNQDFPSATTPNNVISMWWDDLNPEYAGNVYHYYDAVLDIFIVSFVHVPNFLATPGGTGDLNFQAVLYPNGDIVFNYGLMDPGTDTDGLNSATAGIENSTGTDGLDAVYNAAYMHTNLTIRWDAPPTWLSTELGSGWLPSADPALSFNVIANAADIDEGTYTGAIMVGSDDPDEPTSTIVVTFTVGGGSDLCAYRPGDINGNGTTNGIDVGYGVNYFKGAAAPPITCPMCPQPAPFYAAGDVNGSCVFNGIDITFFVNYLKGIVPALLNCPTCPPAPLAAPAVEPLKARTVETQQ